MRAPPQVSKASSGPGSTPLGVAPSYAIDERRLGQIGLGAAALTVIGGVIAGLVFGPATTVLIFAAGAFVAVIALFWSSLRTVLGETSLSSADAYAMGAPRDEEEQKRAVLRALKDLEFERSVGKISEDDYRQLVFHYRGEAKRLLRLIDERSEPLRKHAEELIAARLLAEGLGATAPETPPVPENAFLPEGAAVAESTVPEAGVSVPEVAAPEPPQQDDDASARAGATDDDDAPKEGRSTGSSDA